MFLQHHGPSTKILGSNIEDPIPRIISPMNNLTNQNSNCPRPTVCHRKRHLARVRTFCVVGVDANSDGDVFGVASLQNVLGIVFELKTINQISSSSFNHRSFINRLKIRLFCYINLDKTSEAGRADSEDVVAAPASFTRGPST